MTNLAKVVVSLAALAWVLTQIPFGRVWQAVQGANWWLLLAVYVMFVVSLAVRAVRWLILVRALGSDVRLGRLVELYFVGSFFNSFLPSGFGGDVVRAAEVTRDMDSGMAVGTVVVDRLTGLLVLFVMALISLPVAARELPRVVVVSLGALAALGLAFGGLLLHGSLLDRVGRLVDRWLPTNVARLVSPTGDGPVGRIQRAVTGCGRRAVAGALAVSVVFNVMLIFWWLLTGLAIGIDLPAWAYMTFVPVLSLSLMVPSIGGLGVREGLASVLFASAGVAEEKGVALSLILFFVNRATGVVGGAVYLAATARDLKRHQRDQA
jgi:hypothetical protein